MRRIHFLCLCVLASALKPPRRQTGALRPRARAPVAKESVLGVPRGGGISWGRALSRGVAEIIILYAAFPAFKSNRVFLYVVPMNLGFAHNVVLRLLSLGQIMTLDDVQTKRLRAVGLATSLAIYIGSFCKAWHPRLAHDIFEPKSGFLTWSVLAYWAYALKQIYLAGGRAAVLSKETLGPAACAIAAYFLLANLPELLGF